MRRLKITICFMILSIFIYWINYASLCWAVIEDERWSIDFTNCDISDALSQITKMSGIKIIANSSINKRVADKSYKNMTLDRILSDLLRGQNCAIVWRYNERGLNSIDIWNFGQSGNVGGSVMTASNESVEPNIEIKSAVQSGSNIQKANVINVTNTSSSSNSKNNLSNTNRYSTVKNNVVSNNQAATKTQPVSNSSGSSSSNKNRGFTSSKIKKVENKSSSQISSIPRKWNYLEAPPMPPGLSNAK